MRKLGLVGGTGPESTIPYYHGIVYGVQQRVGRKLFPKLTIESVDVYEAFAMCERQAKEEYIAYFVEAITNLQRAGADFAAISANTPHMYFDEIQALAPLPLISIVTAARAEACKRGYKRLGLLGTAYTMQADFYQRAFAESGIELLLPTEAEIDYIGGVISSELELGIKNPATLAQLQQILKRQQREQGIEAVVLGCTELPLLLNDAATPVPCLDTMQIHIQELVDVILGTHPLPAFK